MKQREKHNENKRKKTRDTITYLIYLFGIVYEDLNGNKHAFFLKMFT